PRRRRRPRELLVLRDEVALSATSRTRSPAMRTPCPRSGRLLHGYLGVQVVVGLMLAAFGSVRLNARGWLPSVIVTCSLPGAVTGKDVNAVPFVRTLKWVVRLAAFPLSTNAPLSPAAFVA